MQSTRDEAATVARYWATYSKWTRMDADISYLSAFIRSSASDYHPRAARCRLRRFVVSLAAHCTGAACAEIAR